LPREESEQTLVGAERETTAAVAVEPEDQAACEVEWIPSELTTGESSSHGGLLRPEAPPGRLSAPECEREVRCDFCGRPSGIYSRNSFLSRR
jgi:hypothetical protein